MARPFPFSILHSAECVEEEFCELRRIPRTRTSPYRVSGKFALIEYSELRVRQESYFWLYEP
jgi:hypothetical protein